jgi:uncharacterized protein YqgC (DUF456 family)
MSPWLELAVLAAMIVGLVGLVVPVLPGLALMWGAALVWVVLDGGGPLRWSAFAVITILAVAGTAAATWLSGRRASGAGAPWWVLAVGIGGMIIGFFVIPILGLVIGGVAAIWIAELIRLRDPRQAWETTWAALQGYGVGTAVQLAAGVAVLLVWLMAVLAS